MGFFDLNIPYTESNKRNPTTEKSIRLKLAVKAMELGYTGVAYNRTITGVMSEVDRCSISLFPLSSVLKVSPSISTSVNLHRRLLNVPTSTPFRQYTRLTVVVDTPAQGSSLNSGNPVLKTYDIVAVKPLKQDSFEQACKHYEVDIIAIDFSENRFRLKQPFIKAAIERGVYFEITYSGLVLDAQLRRQIISNAKVLVEWTQGKNLIFSSAAPSVTEIRGPYDVANLASSLLGLSMERAKASVSRTCRTLLEKGLRKKKFYKEAIRVELITSAKQTDIEEANFDDWLKWDPISSGEGDLQLDDMAKSFAASSKESKTVKAIDFVSIIDELPLQIKDIVSEPKLATDSESLDLPENNCDISFVNENLENVESCGMIIEEETKIPIVEHQNVPAEVHEVISEAFSDNPSILEREESKRFSCDASLSEGFLEEEHTGDVAVTPVSSCLNEDVPEEELASLRCNDELQNKNGDLVVDEPLEDMIIEFKDHTQTDAPDSSSERVRRKRWSSRQSVSFPFKRLLKPSHFKKLRKHKTKNTILSLSKLLG